MAHDRKFRFAAQLSKAPDGTGALLGRAGPQGGGPRLQRAARCPTTSATSWPRYPPSPPWPPRRRRCAWASLVFCNDYRHPFVLAKEAATLDLLSDGRFELSLGAGWMRTDYDEAGIAYDHPAVRVSRFEEAVKVVQGLLRTDGPFISTASTTRCCGHTLTPRPVQQPGPPADHRRRRQAGAVLRGAARRHRQHQRQPARGHGRGRDGRRRHAGAHPHQGRPGSRRRPAPASTTSS